MRILVAMSGGVDSAVAAALLKDEGHEVVGATMKLWGGRSDSGCCSVADVTDARRVVDHLEIEHRVFNFSESFDALVVEPYVEAHRDGRTPNPCVACNEHLKFGRFLERALRLGFDAIATGHHARLARDGEGQVRLRRGVDRDKDQSYVLATLSRSELDHVVLPIGELDKSEVRRRAAARGIRVADKPDSQDVCFIASRTAGEGRRSFLRERIELHAGALVDAASGAIVGETDAIELVTVGQRRGLGAAPDGARRFAVSVDIARREVRVGSEADLLVERLVLTKRTWIGESAPPGTEVLAQVSAHGAPRPAVLTEEGIVFASPERGVAPGQVVACYRGEEVVGSGVAA